MDALLQDDAEGVFQRHELMCASRHRAQLSFVDKLDKN
jgi:hypothetical protein